MVFTIVFGLHYNFLIALPIYLFPMSNKFFTRQDMHARKIGRVSEVLHPSGKGPIQLNPLNFNHYCFIKSQMKYVVIFRILKQVNLHCN